MKLVRTVAEDVGKGLVAGFVGTAAMTVSSSLEAKLRGRQASSAPARATAKMLGIKEFEDGIAAARFNDLSHWGYGDRLGRGPRPARRDRHVAEGRDGRARRRDLRRRTGHPPCARDRAPPSSSGRRRRLRSMPSTTRSTPQAPASRTSS